MPADRVVEESTADITVSAPAQPALGVIIGLPLFVLAPRGIAPATASRCSGRGPSSAQGSRPYRTCWRTRAPSSVPLWRGDCVAGLQLTRSYPSSSWPTRPHGPSGASQLWVDSGSLFAVINLVLLALGHELDFGLLLSTIAPAAFSSASSCILSTVAWRGLRLYRSSGRRSESIINTGRGRGAADFKYNLPQFFVCHRRPVAVYLMGRVLEHLPGCHGPEPRCNRSLMF